MNDFKNNNLKYVWEVKDVLVRNETSDGYTYEKRNMNLFLFCLFYHFLFTLHDVHLL